MVPERQGKTLPIAVANTADAVAPLRQRVAMGSIVQADDPHLLVVGPVEDADPPPFRQVASIAWKISNTAWRLDA